MNYYDEVNSYVKKVEIGKAIRETNANMELVECYWNVGRLIVEAQGGKEKAKYGNELIKTWAEKLTEEYGKGYNYTNLSRFRQFYLAFPIVAPLGQQLSWTIIRTILPIKDENKRNYYINLCIANNLSKRELEKEIKSNSYERLEYKPDKIDVVVSTKVPAIVNNFKNPILLELKDKEIKSESDLEKLIYSQLSYVFLQLGKGFTWVGNQYKVSDGNKNYFIDMLLYNYIYNCFVVVEIKCRKLKKEDKGQVEFYMNLVDNYVKEASNNPTIGIIITKDQDKFVANFVRSEKVVPLTYELVK
jgi:predicted nuclease of restriction endonuclease-like (RecB) superfamily